MDVSYFIGGRLRFKGQMAMISIAVSFLVMIVAVSVSYGFRHEIRDGLADISGDIQLAPPDLNVMDSSQPVEREPAYLEKIMSVPGVDEVIPVVYRAGIVKNGTDIHGVLFKAVPDGQSSVSGVNAPDSISLQVAVPRRFSEISGLKPGDRMLTYFIGDRITLRQFNVVSVYDPLMQTDDRIVVYASLDDLQRVNGWQYDQVSALEARLGASYKDESVIREVTEEVGAYVNAYSSESEAPVIAVSSVYRFPVLYDWLGILDFNVFFILSIDRTNYFVDECRIVVCSNCIVSKVSPSWVDSKCFVFVTAIYCSVVLVNDVLTFLTIALNNEFLHLFYSKVNWYNFSDAEEDGA